ncbi:MAG: alpha-rhamnosidase, partial [Tannerella sp.]|nr:alpha-rhamnosidase [Tannerella sp.]
MKKISFFVCCGLLAAVSAGAQVKPERLLCEHLTNPVGMDAPSPRLSWIINDARHGAVQQAYRIVVGLDSAQVAAGRGEVWDTQKTASVRMLTTYQGRKLSPFTR